MKPAPFTYHRPATLDEALVLLARYGDEAKAIAGGQSLVPMLNLRIARPDHLVDLGAIPALDGIAVGEREIAIGALATHHAVATSAAVHDALPLLAELAATIGHYAIRRRGTVGGSLAHADPAAQWPLAAIALDAEIDVRGADGVRTVAAAEFFEAMMTTALAPEELIERVRFPRPEPGWRYAHAQFARRHGDFALAAAIVGVRGSREAGEPRRAGSLGGPPGTVAGRVDGLRVAVGGATGVAIRVDAALSALHGRAVDPALPGEIAARAAAAIEPDPHPRIDVAYRAELVADVVARAARRALGLARGDRED